MWVKDGPISSRYLYNIEALAHSMTAGAPNGTTEDDWKVMEARGALCAISDVIVAASAPASELASEVAKSHR